MRVSIEGTVVQIGPEQTFPNKPDDKYRELTLLQKASNEKEKPAMFPVRLWNGAYKPEQFKEGAKVAVTGDARAYAGTNKSTGTRYEPVITIDVR